MLRKLLTFQFPKSFSFAIGLTLFFGSFPVLVANPDLLEGDIYYYDTVGQNRSRPPQRPHPNNLHVPTIPAKQEITVFSNAATDKTAYPYIQTAINFVEGHFSFKAFLADGTEVSYSTRGEHVRYSKCFGELCIIISQKNVLGVSNTSTEWEKGHIFGEERYEVAVGHRAALVASDRKLYLYNSYTNHWETISLEQETLRSFANLYDKVAIITSRRILVIDLTTEAQFEQNLLLRRIYQFELRDGFINFYSGDKLWMFRHQTEAFEEVDLTD
ncbi:Hypothetical protein LBF_2951 [Leptospira biflexa serovar Patoc strain 'Patoc 1 (Ames)']|uniref:Uncharacterized protein n=1 Tax=Leptospira biflexa serovar Patoc (strain Patoc 1 / ATCC 23582 / Paris) TaxID=456481 RepID=B0SPL6_LEPBP|nr:hypothetical protein [Leptospira biflexa]ABZ95423.1 Hypothetical protein LBF_2951 [Leptospira biflexa serovar Patoc strain 'Patoc 1 (Ames)']ABZ99122.1 Hypothetical protein; putative signal peptide [Leptospira biflexa serovar Patoc strain 'Patoc 1 (Paris)']